MEIRDVDGSVAHPLHEPRHETIGQADVDDIWAIILLKAVTALKEEASDELVTDFGMDALRDFEVNVGEAIDPQVRMGLEETVQEAAWLDRWVLDAAELAGQDTAPKEPP